jgi:hypothetical protein
MEVNGQLHASAGERATGTYRIGSWVDSRSGLDAVEKRKILPLLGIEYRPSSYTD